MFTKTQTIPFSLPSTMLPLEDGARVHVFPPDFLHGNAELDELYGSFDAWAERLVFVRPVVVDGFCVALSVARFDDWFLTVEHHVGVEVDAWMSGLEDVTVIELAVEGSIGEDREHWVVLGCDRLRLEEMEQTELDVTRDVAAIESSWWQTAQTDLLSTVCLTARLGRLH